jgi:hypothetical protein
MLRQFIDDLLDGPTLCTQIVGFMLRDSEIAAPKAVSLSAGPSGCASKVGGSVPHHLLKFLTALSFWRAVFDQVAVIVELGSGVIEIKTDRRR